MNQSPSVYLRRAALDFALIPIAIGLLYAFGMRGLVLFLPLVVQVPVVCYEVLKARRLSSETKASAT